MYVLHIIKIPFGHVTIQMRSLFSSDCDARYYPLDSPLSREAAQCRLRRMETLNAKRALDSVSELIISQRAKDKKNGQQMKNIPAPTRKNAINKRPHTTAKSPERIPLPPVSIESKAEDPAALSYNVDAFRLHHTHKLAQNSAKLVSKLLPGLSNRLFVQQ